MYCKECDNAYRKLGGYKKRSYQKNKDRIIKDINNRNKERDCGLYFKYMSMVRRCTYPSQNAYRWYGALGIIVEWSNYKHFKKDMYDSFMEHVKVYGHKDTTLDRIDPSKNYSKNNCRWVTVMEQSKNKRKTGSIYKNKLLVV